MPSIETLVGINQTESALAPRIADEIKCTSIDTAFTKAPLTVSSEATMVKSPLLILLGRTNARVAGNCR